MIAKLKKRWKDPKFNKMTAVLFVVSFSLLGLFAVSSYAVVDPFHPDGTLVRDHSGTLTNYTDDKIYLLQSGKKRPLDDMKVLLSHGYNQNLIKSATDADLRLPTGEKVQFKEGTILLGSDSLPYVVDDTKVSLFGLTRQQTNSRNIVNNLNELTLMGYGGDLLVALLAGKITNNFPAKGLPIKNQSIHYDGTIVRSGKNYYLIENSNIFGTSYKRPIPNPDNEEIPKIVKSYDYGLRSGNLLDLLKIKQATKEDLALPTAQKSLDYREGTLIKGPDGTRYVVDYDNSSGVAKLRPFASELTFKSLGYTDQEMINVSANATAQYPIGPKIEFSGLIVPANKPPTAKISASPTSANVNEVITFDSSGSSDSDGSIVKYSWSFGDDQIAEGAKVTHSYSKAATYSVKLTVTDDKGLVSSQSTQVTVNSVAPPPPVPSPNPAGGPAGAGYVIWDSATWLPDHLAAMPRQKPSLIRWAISWDRQLANELKHLVNPLAGFTTISWPAIEPPWHGTNRNTDSDKFFKQLQASCYLNYGGSDFDINNQSSWGTYDAKRCITLVVSQHGMKDLPYDWPASVGACPNGAASICHWPDFISGKMASYMQELYDILRLYLPKEKIIWEDYNEVDLRWGSKKQANPLQGGATMNYTKEWKPLTTGGNLYSYGTAPYAGGTGDNWVKMHQLVKDRAGSSTPITYASGSISNQYNFEYENAAVCPEISPPGASLRLCRNEDWVKATAPLVGYSSFHGYGGIITAGPINDGSGNDFESKMTDYMDVWKKYKGFDMPFYFGEIGPSSRVETNLTKTQAQALIDRHNYLNDPAKSPRTAGKYLGMAFLGHIGTYDVQPWNTRYGWWDSRFDPDDVITGN